MLLVKFGISVDDVYIGCWSSNSRNLVEENVETQGFFYLKFVTLLSKHADNIDQTMSKIQVMDNNFIS